MEKVMKLGFVKYLLSKLEKSRRKTKEFKHSQDAMKNEEVII